MHFHFPFNLIQGDKYHYRRQVHFSVLTLETSKFLKKLKCIFHSTPSHFISTNRETFAYYTLTTRLPITYHLLTTQHKTLNIMASQQQNSSAMVLYLPFTFGANGNKRGTTQEQVFWHMRNLRWGYVDHIDMKERVIEKKTADGSSYKMNVRSWFVHFSTWNAPDSVTEALRSDDNIQIPYDDYGHYWNVKMYVPSERPAFKTQPGAFKIVKKDEIKTRENNRFDGLEVEKEQETAAEEPAADC